MRTVLVILPILLACGGSNAPVPSSPPVVAADPGPPASGSGSAAPAGAGTTASCDALSRAQCLESTTCTLHLVGDNYYECRPEVGQCETGLTQSDGDGCRARAGCEFVAASCYCPCAGASRSKAPDTGTECDCVCGGGAPATCRPVGGR